MSKSKRKLLKWVGEGEALRYTRKRGWANVDEASGCPRVSRVCLLGNPGTKIVRVRVTVEELPEGG